MRNGDGAVKYGYQDGGRKRWIGDISEPKPGIFVFKQDVMN